MSCKKCEDSGSTDIDLEILRYIGGWTSEPSEKLEFKLLRNHRFYYDYFQCNYCHQFWLRDHQEPIHYIGGNVIWYKVSHIPTSFLTRTEIPKNFRIKEQESTDA